MIDEKGLKAEFRLQAIEQAVCRLHASLMASQGMTLSQVDKMFAESSRLAAEQTVGLSDPALEALAAGEWADAYTRLQDMTRELMAEMLSTR